MSYERLKVFQIFYQKIAQSFQNFPPGFFFSNSFAGVPSKMFPEILSKNCSKFFRKFSKGFSLEISLGQLQKLLQEFVAKTFHGSIDSSIAFSKHFFIFFFQKNYHRFLQKFKHVPFTKSIFLISWIASAISSVIRSRIFHVFNDIFIQGFFKKYISLEITSGIFSRDS